MKITVHFVCLLQTLVNMGESRKHMKAQCLDAL